MKTRRLGNSDLHISGIGFGAWAVGGGGDWGWGVQEDSSSITAIHRALELGINWIDTAASYGHGRSEEVVGRAVSGRRSEVILATKCGIVWDEQGNNFFRLKAWSVRQEAEASLRRLGVDVIDLYQIHRPDPAEDIEEAWTEVARLIEEGKIRFGGVSNWNVEQIRKAQAIHPVTSVQPQYHMLDRSIESDLLAYCAEQGIGVIVYSPMASGLLSGKFTRERAAALPADDWRSRHNPDFQEPRLSANLQLVEGLAAIAGRFGRSVGELAIAWTLRRPEVTAAIVGARGPAQISETASAADWTLSPADLEEIESLLNRRAAAVQAQAV